MCHKDIIGFILVIRQTLSWDFNSTYRI